MKRTQQEILDRIEEIKERDFFGFEASTLIEFLDFKHAKPFLKEDVKKEEWKPRIDPQEEMIEYMDFAWEKANNKRGISAQRSIDHYTGWLWLDGNEDLAEKIQNYTYYGKPQLIEICKYLNIDHSKYDDGIRENN